MYGNAKVNVPFFFQHCRDNEEIPFDHLAVNRQGLPIFHEITIGGHQLNNNFTIIAKDIGLL